MKNLIINLYLIIMLLCTPLSMADVVYVHNDALGSPIMESDANGDTVKFHYKPFGETLEAMKDDVGYTGHLNDTDLGLTYMQARYYDPVIGRFYSNDPVGFSPNNIHSFGRYTYGNNNPYRYTDPDGNTSKSIFDSLDKTFAKLNPLSSSSPLPNGRGENIKTSVPISVKSKAAAGELIKTTARVSEAVSLVNKPAGVVNTVAEVANIVVNSENKLADSVGLVVSQVAGNKAGNAVGGFLKNNGVEGKVNEVISNGASQEAGNVAKDLTKEIME